MPLPALPAPPSALPVVILCGGRGTRLREHTAHLPKPMVAVGGEPILAHILRHHAHHGFRRFVLCLGYKGAVIQDWFTTGPGRALARDWELHLVPTGHDAGTGARIARVAPLLDAPRFLLTYGDGVGDVDLGALLQEHHRHGRLATVTGVHPPPRFGQLLLDADGGVRVFSEKPQETDTWINGGFFVLEHAVLDRLDPDPACRFEHGPLDGLARDGQLGCYRHPGFWQCMDTFRDWELLSRLWDEGAPPWRTWS